MLAERDNSALVFSETAKELEKVMLQLPQVSCSVIHRFGPGIYIREVCIPAGTFAIGHYQNFEQLNVMLKGRVSVFNDDGSIAELVAPLIFVGKPGRKAGFIHEDMVWLNIYATEETDIEKIESIFLTKSNDWQANNRFKQQAKTFQADLDKADYAKLLEELGVTDEFVKQQARNTADLIDLPHGGYKIKLGESGIEGKGLFATADIAEGEYIAPARLDGKRTIAGRYANHSANPNARMVRIVGTDNIGLIALRTIAGCHGGEDGEEITVNYRDALKLTLEIGKGV